MTRFEENKMVIEVMRGKAESKPTGTYEEMVIFQLGVIATMLADISKSLAIFADKEMLENLPSVTPQEPFINKPCVSSGVCEHDKQKVLDKIRVEVENINVWGMRYNPDTDKDRKPQIVQKVKEHVIEIIDKYKAEIKPQESEDTDPLKQLVVNHCRKIVEDYERGNNHG